VEITRRLPGGEMSKPWSERRNVDQTCWMKKKRISLRLEVTRRMSQMERTKNFSLKVQA
jgi:hypothetical protein